MALLLLHPCSCSTPPSHPFHLPFKKSTSNLLLFTVPTLRRRFVPNRLPPSLNASLAVDSPKLLLEVKDLSAVIAESKQPILKGVNLVIYEGEVNAVMGKNGSGKSTFATEFTRGSVVFKGKNVLGMDPEVRSLTGLFMSFQSPVEIPGVSNIDFLNMAYNARKRTLGLPELGPIEFYGYISPRLNLVNMKVDFLNRNVNKGFSGGERRRNEIFQLAAWIYLALLDEIDSGLDVDALQDVAKAVNGLLSLNNSVLMITHYHRLLEFIKPTYVHIMEDGRIMETGDESMAKRIEKEGYKAISA